MGTRGTWGFVVDEEEKLTYNHFDSYPSGLGAQIDEFLRGVESFLELRERVEALAVVEQDATPTPEQFARLAEFHDPAVSSGGDFYSLLRDTQGDPEKTLASGFICAGGSEFATDSLFCEWGYVIDLDHERLEVYRGFQTEPHTEGRFADRFDPWSTHSFPPYFEGDQRDPNICLSCAATKAELGEPPKPPNRLCTARENYYPIKLISVYAAAELPEGWVAQVEKDAYPDEEED